jgi:hypothetical protein
MTDHDTIIEAMRDNMALQDEPQVGIFWYDEAEDALFGVSKVNACDLVFNANGLKTISTLHQSWWQKEKDRAASRGQANNRYLCDYALVPRGRIFQWNDGEFNIMAGSWINDHIAGLVIEEFDLTGQPVHVVIDEHWELGHGWGPKGLGYGV